MRKLSRRELMVMALGGAAISVQGVSGALPEAAPQRAAGSQSHPSAARRPSSRIGGLQIGCMTWSFRDRPLGEALETIARIGFSSVELWSGHLDPAKSTTDDIAACKRSFNARGIAITSYFVGFDEHSSDADLDRNFQAGKILGVDVLSSNAPVSMIPRVDRACRRHKMYVGLHNEVYGRPEPDQVQFPQDYARVFAHSSPWIGATLDVGHLYAAGYDPVEFIRRHHARTVSIHLKDENRVLPHYTDFAFGKGPTPLAPILHELQRVHFRRAANIEWGVEGMDPAKGIADALSYIRRALA